VVKAIGKSFGFAAGAILLFWIVMIVISDVRNAN
jgi:hypothetical protein